MNATILIQNNGGEVRLPFNEGVFRAVQVLLTPERDLAPAPAPAPVAVTGLAPKPDLVPKSTTKSTPNPVLRRSLRRLTPAEKRAAVKYYVQTNLTVPAAARQMGLPQSTLDKWVRDALGTADRRRMCPAAVQRWIAS